MFLYLFIIALVLVYYVSTRKFNFFKDKGIPYVKPTFLLGNYGDLILQKKSMAEVLRDLCKQFPNEKFIGAFYGTEPVLIPIDPEYIKLILTKDYYYFHGRELTRHMQKEPVALNLFITYGDTWRVLRQNLTPLFTSAKMKNMFHLIQKCSHVYETMLDKEVSISKDLELRDLSAKFTLECIASCAFGIEAQTMTDDPKANIFAEVASSISDPTNLFYYMRVLRTMWPSIFYLFGFKVFTKQMKFFHSLITTVLTKRNYTPSGRNDFIDLVLSWKQNKHIVGDSIDNLKTGKEQKISLNADDHLLVAQSFAFFFGGFETSSNTLSYSLFELAKNPEVQNKVLEEVDSYLLRHNNKLDYECISDMPYLEAVIDETLRLYPVLGVNLREQMEDYTFPNGKHLEKGLRVHIPVYYLQTNPKYFPEPEKFRPERFLGEEKYKVVPYTFMPFGEGPRTCIGMRFAKMQMIAGFITMLKKYKFELADGMPRKLNFKSKSLVSQPTIGIKLKFIEREGWQKRVFAK